MSEGYGCGSLVELGVRGVVQHAIGKHLNESRTREGSGGRVSE